MAGTHAAPADLGDQRRAARLGWYMAELRGRIKAVPPILKLPSRVENALALGSERSWDEQLKELVAAIRAIASGFEVNPDAETMPYHPKDVTGHASDWLTTSMASLDSARSANSGADKAWIAVTVVFQSWDTTIQDHLAERPALAAAYQLGRGLAEIRWATDPTIESDDDYRSIKYLLGESRAEALERSIQRTTGYYDAVTLYALRASLRVWQEAKNLDLRSWPRPLADQATNWHDLVVGDRDGSSFVTPQALLANPSSLVQAARHLWLEALSTLLGAALLVAAAWILTTQAASPQIGLFVGLLGILGISGAGVSLRARQAATGLLTHLQEKVFEDLAAECVTITPRQLAQATPISESVSGST